MIRETEIEAIQIKIGGKLVSNLIYANDTAVCAESQEEAERLIGKVNTEHTKSKTSEIKCEQDKTYENCKDRGLQS